MSGPGSREQSDPRLQIGQALQRPVLSPDGNFVAIITPGLEIHIISLAKVCSGSRLAKRIVLPRTARSFLPQCHIMKWSPEMLLQNSLEDNVTNITLQVASGTIWLLLSDGDRVIVVRTELSFYRSSEDNGLSAEEEPGNILADFEIGKQYGKITLIDFVFSHRHVLILFEMCSNASIISLTKFQRDDILLPKFPDVRSFSQSPQSRYFALLTRSNAQDQISVFSPSDNISDRAQTFSAHTLDAQGIQWCPDGDPLLAVWDSASYGLKIAFFTALGHHLRHLDINSPDLKHELGYSHSNDLWVLKGEWLRRRSKTILTVAGPDYALIYEQKSKASAPMLIASYDHTSMIENSIYPVWQESSTSERIFTRLHTLLETMPNDNVSRIEKIVVNTDCTFIATKESGRPKTVRIWPIASLVPHAVLNFREHVKQILWHPALPNVLLVLTSQKDPRVYVWHDPGTAPAVGIIPLASGGKGAARFEGCWLHTECNKRYLFMLTSPEAFDIGFLDGRGDGVFFNSILATDFPTEEPLESFINTDFTPTRPGREVIHDALWSLTTEKDNPPDSYAGVMRW